MIEQGAFLKSKPISDLAINYVSQEYVWRIKRYLEGLGCRFGATGKPGEYQITFPPGTTDNTYAGQSTQWTHRTVIILPNGTRLTKFVRAPLHPAYPAYATLAFPNDVLFGPEPQTTPIPAR